MRDFSKLAFCFFCLVQNSYAGKSEIFNAVADGNEDSVRQFLTSPRTIPLDSLVDRRGRTLLQIAASRGHASLVQILLSANASPHHRDAGGATVLYMAAFSGNIDIGNSLHTFKDKNVADERGWTPLHVASRHGHADFVAELCKKGGNIDAKTQDGITPLWMASKRGHTPVVAVLLSHKADVNLPGPSHTTSLFIAYQEGHVETAHALLKNDRIDPNLSSTAGRTPLMEACRHGNLSLVQALLAKGAKVTLHDNMGSQALDFATEGGYQDIADLLRSRIEEEVVSSRKLEFQDRQATAGLEKEDAITFFREHLPLRCFYNKFKRLLRRDLLARDVGSSGNFELRESLLTIGVEEGVRRAVEVGTHHVAHKYLCTHSAWVPFVGAAVGAVVHVGLDAVKHHRHHQKECKDAERLSRVVYDDKELDTETELAARCLTFEWQSRLEKSSQEKAEKLAEEAFRRFKKYVNEGRMVPESSLKDEVLKAVNHYPSRLLPGKKFRHKEHGQQRTDNGAFQLSDLRTPRVGARSYQRLSSRDGQSDIDDECEEINEEKRVEEHGTPPPHPSGDTKKNTAQLSEEADLFVAMEESHKLARERGEVGPRTLPGWTFQDVDDRGNCFYDATVDQFTRLSHSFLREVPEGTQPRDSLRLRIQGEEFKDQEWTEDRHIDTFVREFPDVILGIVDTQRPKQGFTYRFRGENGEVVTRAPGAAIPLPPRAIVRLAWTGNHFMSVVSMPSGGE